MKLFRKHSNTVGDNDAFVTLIQVAKEDADIRKQLQAILAQPPFHRKSMLNMLISQMKLKSAPPEFIAAIASLLDDEVATKAMEVINEKLGEQGVPVYDPQAAAMHTLPHGAHLWSTARGSSPER